MSISLINPIGLHTQISVLDAPVFIVNKYKSRGNATIEETSQYNESDIFTCVFIDRGAPKTDTCTGIDTADMYLRFTGDSKLRICNKKSKSCAVITKDSYINYLIKVVYCFRSAPKSFSKVKYLYVPIPVSTDVYYLNFLLMCLIIISDLHRWDADFNTTMECNFLNYLLANIRDNVLKRQLCGLLLTLVQVNCHHFQKEQWLIDLVQFIAVEDGEENNIVFNNGKTPYVWSSIINKIQETCLDNSTDLVSSLSDFSYPPNLSTADGTDMFRLDFLNQHSTNIFNSTVDHHITTTFSKPVFVEIANIRYIVCIVDNVDTCLNHVCLKIPHMSSYIVSIPQDISASLLCSMLSQPTIGHNCKLLYSKNWFITRIRSNFVKHLTIPYNIIIKFIQHECLLENRISNILSTVRYLNKSVTRTRWQYMLFIDEIYNRIDTTRTRFSSKLRYIFGFEKLFRALNRIRCQIIQSVRKSFRGDIYKFQNISALLIRRRRRLLKYKQLRTARNTLSSCISKKVDIARIRGTVDGSRVSQTYMGVKHNHTVYQLSNIYKISDKIIDEDTLQLNSRLVCNNRGADDGKKESILPTESISNHIIGGNLSPAILTRSTQSKNTVVLNNSIVVHADKDKLQLVSQPQSILSLEKNLDPRIVTPTNVFDYPSEFQIKDRIEDRIENLSDSSCDHVTDQLLHPDAIVPKDTSCIVRNIVMSCDPLSSLDDHIEPACAHPYCVNYLKTSFRSCTHAYLFYFPELENNIAV